MYPNAKSTRQDPNQPIFYTIGRISCKSKGMGLQNAIMTKISKAEIRTTHMTGVVTDIGIELGGLLYWNRDHSSMPQKRVVADREKLKIHLVIFSLFLIGGIVGALSFKHFGYVTTVPLAGLLILISLPPITKDLVGLLKSKRD